MKKLILGNLVIVLLLFFEYQLEHSVGKEMLSGESFSSIADTRIAWESSHNAQIFKRTPIPLLTTAAPY